MAAASLKELLLNQTCKARPLLWDGELVEAARTHNLKPQLDRHLAFSLPLVLGGDYSVENLCVERSAAHLAMLGGIVSETRSLPDGTKIARII